MASFSFFLPTLFASLLAFQLFPLSSSSVITIPLYHIEHFIKSNFKDHNSLVLARLARDEARQKQLAVIFNASLNAHPNAKSKYTSTPLSTGPQGGEYVALVRVGSQRQKMHLLLDTGSSLIWWQCQPCIDCYNQRDPIFNPALSSSYEEVMCKTDKCDDNERFIETCDESKRCSFRFQYLDGSSLNGDMSSEDITTDDGQLFQNITFGCAYSYGGDFSGHYAGILGFDQGDYSFPSQIDAAKFSFCLVQYNSDESSTLYLYQSPDDDYDDDYDDDKITMSMILNYRNPHHYYVKIRGVAIAGEMVPIGSSTWEIDLNGNYGVMVDTGTTVSRFPPEAYAIFRDYFRKEVSDSFESLPPPKTKGTVDTCYNISWYQRNEIPTVTFYFANNKVPLRLDFDRIMILVDGLYCLAFSESKDYPHSIIGSWQLQTTKLSFDLSAQTISFYLNSCHG